MSIAGKIAKVFKSPFGNIANRATRRFKKQLESRLPQAREVMLSGGNFMDAAHFLYTGEKFAGGWGVNRNYEVVNLPLMRNHSLELWRSNPAANAIYGRLETKVINDGLRVEALPEPRFIGFDADSQKLQEWSDSAEAFMHLWACDPSLVDERERLNFYQQQRQCYSAAKLSGDCLVIRRIDPVTMYPRIQLIDGKHIDTPFQFINGINPKTGRDVIHGVEIDSKGREVGYWIRRRAFNPNLNAMLNHNYIFVSAFGANSGRRVANLVYGSRLRVDEYRGIPLLGCSMQMLKQIDRTLDNQQLAMALDNTLVLSVVTDKDAPRSGADVLGEGPVKKAAVTQKTVDVQQPDGNFRQVDFRGMANGIMFDRLPAGKKIESHNTRHPNPDVAKVALFGLNLVAAAAEVPPEIMMLLFNNNFSASRQAVNEFEAVKRKEHSQFNPQFNDPIYQDIIIGLDITGKLPTPGLMRALVDNDRLTFNAWTQTRWASTSELSVDMLKHLSMFEKAFKNGLVTRRDVALKFFGTRHEKVVARLAQENAKLAEANRPLVELEKTPAAPGGNNNA